MKQLLLVMISAAVLAFAGCGTVADLADSGWAKPAIQYATIKAVDGDSGRAVRVVEAADSVLAVIGGDASATIANLVEVAKSELDIASLDPADQIIALTLINAAQAELTRRAEGRTDLETELNVREVVGWIRDAAAIGIPAEAD